MADVQREHGYTGIANRLLEAIVEAGFSERQQRILLVLMRLTYGWRRATVLLTELDLAGRAGGASQGARRASGSFRADLHDLLENRVIVRVETDERGLFTWAINKDFEQWKAYSHTADWLSSRWDERPKQARGAHDAVKERLAQSQATSIEAERPESGPHVEGEWPEHRPLSGPAVGHNVARTQATNPDFGVDFQGVRASERNGKKEKEIKATATTTREDDDVKTAYALRITQAANLGITKRWGEQINCLNYGGSTQLAADLIAAEVPLEVAVESIEIQCARKKGEKPGTIEYFRPGIVEHNRRHKQKQFEADHPPEPRSGDAAPTRIHVPGADEVERQKQMRSDTEIAAQYSRERATAIAEWAKNNPDRYRLIVAAANQKRHELLEKMGKTPDSPLGTKARDATIAERCAEESGFPSLADWKLARAPSTPSAPTA